MSEELKVDNVLENNENPELEIEEKNSDKDKKPKEKKKKSKGKFFVILILVVLIFIGGFTVVKLLFPTKTQVGCIETKTPYLWSMSYDKLSGKYDHELKLSKDSDMISIHVQTRSGNLTLKLVEYRKGEVFQTQIFENVNTGDYLFENIEGKKIEMEATAKDHVGEFEIKAKK